MDKFYRALDARSTVDVLARATGETVTNPNLAVYTVNDYDGIGAGTDSYTFYSGDGSTADGWPDQSQWFVMAFLCIIRHLLMWRLGSPSLICRSPAPSL